MARGMRNSMYWPPFGAVTTSGSLLCAQPACAVACRAGRWGFVDQQAAGPGHPRCPAADDRRLHWQKQCNPWRFRSSQPSCQAQPARTSGRGVVLQGSHTIFYECVHSGACPLSDSASAPATRTIHPRRTGIPTICRKAAAVYQTESAFGFGPYSLLPSWLSCTAK